MKFCPKCTLQYADDTLSFCLEDGTPLSAFGPGDMPTAVLSESDLLTSVRAAKPAHDPRFMDSQVTRVGSFEGGSAPSAPRKGNTAVAVAITAVGMIVLFGVVGLVGYALYLNSDRNNNTIVEPNKNSSTPNVQSSNASPVSTPVQSPPANAAPANVPASVVNATPQPVDVAAIRSEVLKEIYGSKSARDSRDLSSYMGYYAETLDRYYTKRGMSRAGVRADKARHFSNYSSMQSDYSNMNVSVSPDGQTVTAVFDKEWNFSGVKNSSGKVQSQLIFKRINGQWLITTERDLKVYYTR